MKRYEIRFTPEQSKKAFDAALDYLSNKFK